MIAKFDIEGGKATYLNLAEVVAVCDVAEGITVILKCGEKLIFPSNEATRKHVYKTMDEWSRIVAQGAKP